MKKIYVIAAALLTATFASAQNSFSDDFESYTVGQYIGATSPNWTTWDGVTGGTEDTQVENTMNNTPSGSQSCHWVSTLSGGGPQDCVLPFGGTHTTGNFTYQMDMFVDANQGAYFNFQGTTTPGQSFAMECYMPQTGDFTMTNQQGLLLTGTYPTNQWFTFRFDINLNANQWDVYINNVLQGSFANTVNSIGAIDIYAYNGAAPGNNNASFYVDDVSYVYTPYTLPALNGAVTQIGGVTTGLATMQKYPTVTVRNLGTTTITSYDLAFNYNSQNINQSFTCNLASLASQTVTLNTMVTLAPGANNATATISNVNGNAVDGDASDDIKTIVVDPTVPAPGKVVVAEEATGTWCPWCVRGTVNMDRMSTAYGSFFAGIAVHNNDPMTVTAYDAAMGTHISGYPSVLIDRQAAIDPSAMDAPFLQRVQVVPVATITNDATLAGNTLTVNVNYTFPNAMSGTNYAYACVLTEDSLYGTGSTWSQNNAYAGGANGPMGGFESLPNPVPYSQMHYDHVARAINPGWNGTAGFPASITANQTITETFTFDVTGMNLNRMHIIGMLIDPAGLIDNASFGTANSALGVGIAQPTESAINLSVYPNPTDGMSFATIDLAKSENVTISIIDVTGKVVAERNYGQMIGNNVLPIDASNFAAGIYMVTVTTGSAVTTQKLVVQ
jgi:hypothetical protein